MCLCGRTVMSHFGKFAVIIKNNLTLRKGVDITFSLFIMTKIELCLKNKLWILLSPMTTTGSYLENKLFMPLSPIRRNYPKIIINNGPEFYCDRLKKALVTKPCCGSTVRLPNAGMYEFVDIEIVI